MTDHEIQCDKCPAKIENVEAAIDADWIPSYFEPGDDQETGYPLCPDCQEKCRVTEDGQMEWVGVSQEQQKLQEEINASVRSAERFGTAIQPMKMEEYGTR